MDTNYRVMSDSRSLSLSIPAPPVLKYEYRKRFDCSSAQKSEHVEKLVNLSPMAKVAYGLSSNRKVGCFLTAISKIRRSEFPMPPSRALMCFQKSLSKQDVSEIRNYSSIYFIGKKAQKLDVFCDSEGHYIAPINDHLMFRYEIIEEIGRGAFGKVLKCFDHRASRLVAVKVLKNSEQCFILGRIENTILEKIKNSGNSQLLECLGSFTFRGHQSFVFELLGTSLYHYLIQTETISEFQLKEISRQVLESLQAIHNLGIIHADIKPDNIIFTDKSQTRMKIIDFGTSVLLEHDDEPHSYVQSRHYRAPEVALGLPYDQSIDMWSFGCVLFEISTFSILFPARSEKELLSMINGNKNKIPDLMKSASPALVDLVGALVQVSPKDRLTPEQALRHPWFVE